MKEDWRDGNCDGGKFEEEEKKNESNFELSLPQNNCSTHEDVLNIQIMQMVADGGEHKARLDPSEPRLQVCSRPGPLVRVQMEVFSDDQPDQVETGGCLHVDDGWS